MLKKILTLFLCVVMLLTTLPMTSVALERSSGEMLKAYGIITGDTQGNLNEEAYLTRAEMTVIFTRLMGEFDAASTYTGSSTFIDGKNHWAEPFVAYAQSRRWVTGVSFLEFGYNQRHTVRETAVFMLRALGYQTDVDFSWWTAFDLAKDQGLIPDHLNRDEFIQRRDLFEIIYRTLNTPGKSSNLPLIYHIPLTSDVLQVNAIRAAGKNAVELIFNEPLSALGEVAVYASGYQMVIDKAVLSGVNRVVLEFSEALEKENSYVLKIERFEGKDGDLSIPRFIIMTYGLGIVPLNKAMSAMTPVEVQYDSDMVNAETTAELTAASQTHLSLEFSNAVTGLTVGHLKYNGGDSPLGFYLDQEMTQPVNPQDPVSKVYAKLAEKTGSGITGKPLQAGTSEIRIEGTTSSGAQLTDGWGNIIEKMVLPVTVEGDGTPPAVTRLERIAGSSNTLRVEFSEPVTLAANQVEVRYSTGALIPGLWVSVSGSGSAYTLQLNDANLSGRSIRVTLRNVSDLALLPNTMTAHSTTLSFPDLERPFVTDALMDSVSKRFYVTFNKPVDLSSATSRSRYAISYGGSALVLSRTPEQVGTSGSGARTFRLSLTSTEYTLAQSTGAQLTVSGVQDLSGNAMSTQSFTVSTMTDVSKNPPQLVSVYATDSRSVTAVFNQPLTRVDSGAFKVNLASVSSMTFSVSGGQTLVRLQTASALPANLASVSLLVDTTGVSKVQNLYGIDVRNTTRVIEDRR